MSVWATPNCGMLFQGDRTLAAVQFRSLSMSLQELHCSSSGYNVETIQYKNIDFTVWDVGGQDKVRLSTLLALHMGCCTNCGWITSLVPACILVQDILEHIFVLGTFYLPQSRLQRRQAMTLLT